MIVKPGSTNVSTYVVLRKAADDTEMTGAVITDMDLQYVRSGSTPSAKADATALATADAAHGDNKAIEIDATNQPGLYRVDWPDAAFLAGVREVILSVKLATCKTVHLQAELQAGGDICDAIWDEVLTSGTHNIVNSAGRRLRNLDAFSIIDGQAVAGAALTITLDEAASAVASIYNQNLIIITSGTGAGQSRMIVSYTTDKVATIDRPWDVIPDVTSFYQINFFSGILLAAHGLAVAGGPSSITLPASCLDTVNSYVGSAIYIAAGTGAGQTRLITAYSAARVATISPAWELQPDSTSIFKILPVGRSIVESLSAAALTAIQQAESGTGLIEWDYTLTDSGTGLAVADAIVWATTDIGGANIVAKGRTDIFGVVTFFLNAGTYYIWVQKSGYTPDANPDVEVVAP